MHINAHKIYASESERLYFRPKKNICVFPVSRPTLIFHATLNILLHF